MEKLENEKTPVDFSHLGGRKVHHIERKPAVDFESIGGKRVGTISDRLHEMFGGRVLAPFKSEQPEKTEGSHGTTD